MGFEKVALFGTIDLELESTGTATLTLSTDCPGTAIALRETKTIPATITRRVVRFRLQGTTKGRLYSLRITPANGVIMRLYGARIWARVLPAAEWQWYVVPMMAGSEEWTPVKLDIPPMGPWEKRDLEIPKMGQWEQVKLPIAPTAANPEWVKLEMDS